jgi:hypothetical protein
MPGKSSSNPRADANKMAWLSIVWAVVAGIAFLGLLKKAVTLIQAQTNGVWTAPTIDPGLVNLEHLSAGQAHSQVFLIAVYAIPVAIVGAAILGIILRIRPTLVVLSLLLIVASLLGISGLVLLFTNVVYTVSTRNGILLALGTIVVVWILLRLERFARRFYQRVPAVASVVFGIIVLAYLILSNNASISSILLGQADVWLALIAFVIVFYSGIKLARSGQKLRKAG